MIVDSIINRSIYIREVAWALVTWSREGLEEVARYGEAKFFLCQSKCIEITTVPIIKPSHAFVKSMKVRANPRFV